MNVSLSDHDRFVKDHKNSDMLQVSAWGKVKEDSGRDWEIVSVGDGSKITGSVLLIFKKLPFTNLNICYITRGPVLNWEDKETVEVMLEEIKKAAKRNKSIYIRLTPMFLETEDEYKRLLEDHGYKHRGYSFGVQTDLQPRHRMVTDISRSEDELMKSFQSRTKTDVRKSLKNGLEFVEANDKVEVFYDLYVLTSERDDFLISDLDFHKNILKHFAGNDDAKIILIKLNPDNAISNLNKDISKKLKELDKAKSKNEDGSRDMQIVQLQRSIDNTRDQINQIEDIKRNKPDGIYLSGMLYVQTGANAYYLFGASSNDLRDLMPNYFMQYKTMLYAKEHGCKFYDFGGVSGLEDKDNDPEPGLYEFKKRWGSEKISLIGEFDLVLKPFYNGLYEIAFAMKKNISTKKKKLKGKETSSFYD